ncbi:MAG: histidine--tRNA ligase [Chitinivibrionales bacterium]
MQTPSGPKGTRDFYPEDMAVRNLIFGSWERTCRRYAFEPYDGPLFEHLEVYTQKSGDEIEKQLYAFEDKGGRKIALRPELTPTLARMVASRGNALKRPIRWFSIPSLYRYERMQKGRLREFFQLNMDILGVPDMSADAELIAASIAMMTDLGFTADDFSVLISSRTLMEDLFTGFGCSHQQLPAIYATLDKRKKIPQEQFLSELAQITGSSDKASKIVNTLDATKLPDLQSSLEGKKSLSDLKDLFNRLDAYGLSDFVQFDSSIIRGLAYYTGTVFELFDKKRSLRAIAGGGRYDRLVSLYGGPETPAVGFAAGDVVLAELMKAKGFEFPAPFRSEVFIVNLNRDDYKTPIMLTQSLRQAGLGAEYSLTGANVGKQMKQANAARSRFVVFSGGQEQEEDKIKFKDMQSGEELLVAKQELSAELIRRRTSQSPAG